MRGDANGPLSAHDDGCMGTQGSLALVLRLCRTPARAPAHPLRVTDAQELDRENGGRERGGLCERQREKEGERDRASERARERERASERARTSARARTAGALMWRERVAREHTPQTTVSQETIPLGLLCSCCPCWNRTQISSRFSSEPSGGGNEPSWPGQH